jgi:hypothetical protein
MPNQLDQKPSADAVNFTAFFIRWAEIQGWDVPNLHLRMCVWLVDCPARVRVLLVFRGAAKSTLYAIYKAWKLYRARSHRSLIWAADDKLAGKLTRDTLSVLRRHPWCHGMLPPKPGAKSFWVNGASDARNASMEAVGVNGNATGSRADDSDFDDIEVPKNIKTPEARANLRAKIEESTHILVPGGCKTFVGTPHTHDSVYMEQIEGGAAVLKIALFAHSVRYSETKTRTRYAVPFPVDADGLYVLAGIGKGSRILSDVVDFQRDGAQIVFTEPPGVVLDIATGCAWPQRFTRAEIELKRRETRTLNAWDSQYMLEAKPVGEVRIDPARIQAYDCEPRFVMANKRLTMWLGAVQIVGMALRWDPSSGKVNSDASGVVLDLQDAYGRHYWHRVIALTGDIATTSDDGKKVIGGQVMQLCDLIELFRVPRITVESNGIGGFAAPFLRMALKQRRLTCAIAEIPSVQNKGLRILEALEPLIAGGMLWAHVEALSGPLWDQAKDFNPTAKNQDDDLLDAGAGAVTDQPVRVGTGQTVENLNREPPDDWRPGAGVFEATLEA